MNDSSRSFKLLLIGQFLAAFGDNAILAVILGQLLFAQTHGGLSEEGLRLAGATYTALLFVPYVLLAPLAGYANDRFAKTQCLAAGNALRVIGAGVCVLGGGGPWVMGLGYFLVGIGACLYGPAKYGILPEILPREKLVRANGLVELWTLAAILGGAIGGAFLADTFAGRAVYAFAIVAFLFAAALVFALKMPRTGDDPRVRINESVRSFTAHLGSLFRLPRLNRILLGSAIFWWCGAAIKMNFQPWGLESLQLKTNTDVSLLGLWLSLGIMLGSVLAGRLHAVGDLRRTRHYAVALALALCALYFVKLGDGPLTRSYSFLGIGLVPHAIGVLMLAGVAAGLFLIPLNAALQAESDPSCLGKTIAVQNLADNLGMCVAFGFVFLSVKVGLSSAGLYLLLALGIGLALALFRPLSDSK